MPQDECVDDLLTTQEVSALLAMSYEGVIKAIQRRAIPARKFGHSWMVRRDDAERIKEARELLHGMKVRAADRSLEIQG